MSAQDPKKATKPKVSKKSNDKKEIIETSGTNETVVIETEEDKLPVLVSGSKKQIVSPDSIQALSSQLQTSDVIDQHFFIEGLYKYAIIQGNMNDSLRTTIACFLNEVKFFETEKDRITATCEAEGWTVDFVRESKEEGYTVKIKQDGKPETLWIRVIEKGKYEYGCGNFKIGNLTHPSYKQ